MTVSKRLRYEVLRRDNHACRYCGRTAPDVPLTVDHVVPSALGGGDEPENLVTACRGCNSGKTSTNPDQPLVGEVSSDALRWAEAMKEAAAAQAAKEEARWHFIFEFDLDWDEASGASAYWVDKERSWTQTSEPERSYPFAVCDGEDQGLKLFDEEDAASEYCERLKKRTRFFRPADYETTLGSWFAAGITNEELRNFVNLVARKGNVAFDAKWRYLCGCVWGHLRQRQEIAAALLVKKEADQ